MRLANYLLVEAKLGRPARLKGMGRKETRGNKGTRMIRVKGDDTTARRTIGRESRQAKKMREKIEGADACLTRPSQKASIPESNVKQGKNNPRARRSEGEKVGEPNGKVDLLGTGPRCNDGREMWRLK